MLIFLTGFMCSGKTTDGRAVADELKISFLDLDAELEKRSGRSVWSFIEDNGIEEFRHLESEILLQSREFLQRQLVENHLNTKRPEAIIATGGGSVLMKENRDFLMQPDHFVIWLDLPFPLLLERIRKDQRPLLHGLNDDEIYQVWLKRLPFYQNTCTQHISALPVTSQILSLFTLTSY
ncbi:MAG: shikimate kinase [Candidatus Cloacimonadaceae bacterium]